MVSTRVVLATDYVLPNEPCFGLSEVNRVTKVAGAGVRRFQIVQVIRDDQLWEYQRDMGPADSFKSEEFVIPGHVPLSNGHFDVIETVGRLQGAADEWRAKYDKPTERHGPPEDFVKSFEEYATKRRDARKGRRHFAMGGHNAD